MKKIIYLLALIISTSSLISCKKDKGQETIIGTYKLGKYKYVKSDGTIESEGEWDGSNYQSYIQYTDNKEYYAEYYKRNGIFEIDYSRIHNIKIEGNTVYSNGETYSRFAVEYNYKFVDGKVVITYDYGSGYKLEVDLHKVDKNIITDVENDQ